MRRIQTAFCVLLICLGLNAQPKRADVLSGLTFRNIGPANMGGRIDDFAVVESNPSTFYAATASAGIWKTTNGGVTFEPIFDSQSVSSIGDIALAPSDPGILYVGTGEQNNRQSSSWGDGVYKTLDGGKTWTHLGLRDTHHIGRIVVHPRNPSVVYVAAAGRLWGPHKERGLYKSTDGGASWTNTKFINEDTGFIDVAIDPQSPNTLYAASYQRRRTSFGYNGGGPGSGLWKTVDGGATWTKLTKGLPTEGDIGRIGLAVFPRDPRIVYALVEHARQGGIYRSEDKGESWTKMSDTNPRPSYYSQVRIDPNNDLRLWVLAAPLSFTEDGGKTFVTTRGQRIHGDYHDFWINPANSDHVMAGSDGGIAVSWDRGRTWDYINSIALAQFYEVSADMRKPYNVCGGLQDNGSWCGPSRTLWTGGVTNEEWFRIGGGDGFHTANDPSDHNIVYYESQDGNVRRLDMRTWESRVIRPEPPEGVKYRFNWNSPIVISPHDPKTIFYGGNRLFISRDRGDTWTATQDLTASIDRDRRQIFGKTARDFLSRNDGVVHYSTLTTVAESPLKAGVLWAGGDDGSLWVSKDMGKNWTDLSAKPPGVPKETYVSRVEASRRGEGAAYVAYDGHRNGDFKVYLFKTEDSGATWKSISANLPDGSTVSVIREHPKNHNLLFVGTETALWASWNGGGDWQQIKGNLPTVPVDDILIHPRDNDLILGTHGRGVWILDDLAPFEQLADTVLNAELHLFDSRPATQYRVYGNKGSTGHKQFAAPNPPEGALISYYVKTKPAPATPPATPRITITNAAGAVVRELRGPAEAGVNRMNWDLRHEPPVRPDPAAAAGGGGGGGFGQAARGPLVPPGVYTVKVALGAQTATGTVKVEEDPRVQITAADHKLWYDAAMSAGKVLGEADRANRTLTGLRRQLTALTESLNRRSPRPSEAVTKAVKDLSDKVDSLSRRFTRQAPAGFAGAPLADEPDPVMQRVQGLYGAINSMTAPPTTQQRDVAARVAKQVADLSAQVATLRDKDVAALNKLLFDNGIGRIDP